MLPKDYVIDVNAKKGGVIGKIEISPNGTYLIAVILEGDLFHTVVGWNVKDIDKGKDLGWEDEDIQSTRIDVELNNKTKTHVCVSDDKVLAFVDDDDGRFLTNDFSKYPTTH